MKPIHIQDLMAKVVKDTYLRIPESTVTICALKLNNGFTVIGKSACIDPVLFNEAKGKTFAYNDAINQLWEMEGYHRVEANHQTLKGS